MKIVGGVRAPRASPEDPPPRWDPVAPEAMSEPGDPPGTDAADDAPDDAPDDARSAESAPPKPRFARVKRLHARMSLRLGDHWWWFFLPAAPATVAALALGAGMILGVVPVGIASRQPIEVAIGAGIATGLTVDSGDLSQLGGSTASGEGNYGSALHADTARLRSLCLRPSFRIPGLGLGFAIKLTSLAPVHIDDVTLGATSALINSLALPETSVRFGSPPATSGGAVPEDVAKLAAQLGLTPQQAAGLLKQDHPSAPGISLDTHGDVRLHRLDSVLYHLTLDRGIQLTSLRVGGGLGDVHCRSREL